jgi:hypothetical protein
MALKKDDSIVHLINMFGQGMLKSKNPVIDAQLRDAEKEMSGASENCMSAWGKVNYTKQQYNRTYTTRKP